MAGRRSGSDSGFAGEQQRDRGDGEHDADDGERVAEGHDQRLPLDDLANRHDRLMLRRGAVDRPVRLEIIGERADAPASLARYRA